MVGSGGGGGGFGHTDSFNTKMFRSALVMEYAFVFSTLLIFPFRHQMGCM